VTPPALRRDLGLLSLAAIVFFNVSGGPYGIEDAVSSFGPGLTLLLLVLTPLLWSLPVSLAMAELAAAMPDEGGYVTWVRRAFGPFWSFQVGWWSWVDSFVDVAVYPALFVEYLKFWYPDMAPLERWLLAVMFIAVLTVLNVLGVRPTGQAAVVLLVVALLPIALLVVVGIATATQVPWRPLLAEGQTVGASLGVGLACSSRCCSRTPGCPTSWRATASCRSGSPRSIRASARRGSRSSSPPRSTRRSPCSRSRS
jgi:amino acid transporter